MRPPFADIKAAGKDPRLVAAKYKVSVKTATRWLKHYGLYAPSEHFRPGKLDIVKARQIRQRHCNGASMKDLAAEYHVTFSTISRIVHNIVYREAPDKAEVSVIYNPTALPEGASYS